MAVLGDYSKLRDAARLLIQEMGDRLVALGWENYRLGEWKETDGVGHVRVNFAGGEWLVTVSYLPKRVNTRGGSDSQALLPVVRHRIRIDLRHLFRSGGELPTADKLVDGEIVPVVAAIKLDTDRASA